MTENQSFYQELGRRIRGAREANHLTQEALAARVSLTRTSVTNIEKGRQQLLVHTLVQISTALSTPPEALLPSPPSQELDELLKAESRSAQAWVRATVEKE